MTPRKPKKCERAGVGPTRLMTIGEVADHLQLHPRTVRAYVARGELVGHIIGGQWRFKPENVARFVDGAPTVWELARKRKDGE